MSDEQQQERQGVPADLLAKATAMPQGVQLEAYNPMENIPTLGVGLELTEGMTVSGYFEETQTISSPKFIHSKTVDANGVKTQLRHVLRIGSPTGERLAIWNCGELKAAFDKLAPGSFISIKYLRKGVNAKNQPQHFFELQRQAPAAN